MRVRFISPLERSRASIGSQPLTFNQKRFSASLLVSVSSEDPRFTLSCRSSSSMEEAKKKPRGVLDLEAQFAFFRSQHRHPVNAAAHALLAGPILFGNLLILYFLPLPSPLDPALALSLAYGAAYLAVDRRAGALAALLLGAGPPAAPSPPASASRSRGRSCWPRSSSAGPGSSSGMDSSRRKGQR
ncbi:hypothetical protein ACQJBY_065843 [Aegilops geniculata]